MGYIGSHTAKVFKEAGWRVVCVDRAQTIPQAAAYIDQLIVDDYARTAPVTAVIEKVDAIIHCAGSSLVGPSILDPGEYYNNNSSKTNLMMEGLAKQQWYGMVVFSSSAATYGIPESGSYCYEQDPTNPISPYGRSKLFCEHIIRDHCLAHGIRGVALRYFNAAGADLDGQLGHVEDDSHIIPRVLSAHQNNVQFQLYGNDYQTKDKTCVRDYLHVTDIARAHLAATTMPLSQLSLGGFEIYNLGTNKGYSNLDILNACADIVDDTINYRVLSRRVGDPDFLVASSEKFSTHTGWKPIYSDLRTIVQTAWRWQQRYSK